MAENNSFETTVQALFKGMDSFITTKTVVGEAIHIGENIILPLVDVSFGVGAGAFADGAKNNGGGGMGGKITPSAILVINKNGTKLVNIKNQDAITKILDLAPDLIHKFTGKESDDTYTEEEVEHILKQGKEEQE
ncbi:MAG: GerW family sporulation protein [Lachnospiraceae bacterium]|nr:GerW family sporulation protein [Lachnospiraceae bacterium]